MATLLLFSALFLVASCEEGEFHSQVSGRAVAYPSSVRNGDSITLSIGAISDASVDIRPDSIDASWEISFSSGGTATIDGELHHPIVHYLIDGKRVATSNSTDLPFQTTYQVENLSAGEHTLSVSITPSHSHDSYENHVGPSTLTIEG